MPYDIQTDPFTHDLMESYAPSPLMAFAEFPGDPIGQTPWTTHWVSSCYGHNSASLLHGRPVLCSGSVMGTDSGVSHESEGALPARPTHDPTGGSECWSS